MIRTLLAALHVAAVAGKTSLRPLPRRKAAFQLRSHGRCIGLASLGAPTLGVPAASRPNAPQFDGRRSSLASASKSSVESLSLLLRGGGSLLESIPTPPAGAVLVASKVFTAFTLLTGAFALFAPASFSKIALGHIAEDAKEDSFDSSLVQSIGAIAIGFAIHVFLALKISLAGAVVGDAAALGHAMGYALLPRILLIAWSLLKSRFLKGGKGEYQLEGTRFLKINFLVMSWTAFSLLTGTGNPAMSSKVFSTMSVIKSMALVLDPEKMTEKIFGVNVAGEEMAQSRSLSNMLGYTLLVHALLMLSLACGVDPNLAVGATTVAWAVMSVWIPRM